MLPSVGQDLWRSAQVLFAKQKYMANKRSSHCAAVLCAGPCWPGRPLPEGLHRPGRCRPAGQPLRQQRVHGSWWPFTAAGPREQRTIRRSEGNGGARGKCKGRASAAAGGATAGGAGARAASAGRGRLAAADGRGGRCAASGDCSARLGPASRRCIGLRNLLLASAVPLLCGAALVFWYGGSGMGLLWSVQLCQARCCNFCCRIFTSGVAAGCLL